MEVGSDVNLTCVAVGALEPYVSWRLGDVMLTPEDEILLGTNVLVLQDVQDSDNYTCVAESQLGRTEAITEIRIEGEEQNSTPNYSIGSSGRVGGGQAT